LNDHVDDDTVTAWLGANEVITATVNEFYRQVMKRQDKLLVAESA